MRRLQPKEPKVTDLHDIKVQVELSVLELMAIKAALGPESNENIAQEVARHFGEDAGRQASEAFDLSYKLYDAAGHIAKEEVGL